MDEPPPNIQCLCGNLYPFQTLRCPSCNRPNPAYRETVKAIMPSPERSGAVELISALLFSALFALVGALFVTFFYALMLTMRQRNPFSDRIDLGSVLTVFVSVFVGVGCVSLAVFLVKLFRQGQ